MAQFGVFYVALGLAISSIIGLWIDIEPMKKQILYSTIEQLKDVFPSLMTGVILFLAVFFFNIIFNLNPLVMLLLSLVIGVAIFVVMTILFNKEMYSLIYNVIKHKSK